MTVPVPAGSTVDIEFKDENGNVIGSVKGLAGPGEFDLPLPENYSSYDWVYHGQDSAQSGTFTSPPTASASLGRFDLEKKDLFSVGCASGFVGSNASGFLYQTTLKAGSVTAAKSRFAEIVAQGPGGLLEDTDQVAAMVTVTPTLSSVVIVSSLPEPFGAFVIDIDGQVLSDAAIGLNVTSQPLSNGWTQITSVIPIALVQDGTVLHLAQSTAGPQAVTTEVEIAIGS